MSLSDNIVSRLRTMVTKKIHINESLTTYRKKLFGTINAFKQQHNHKFLSSANEKILLRETDTLRITSFSTYEEFNDNFDGINNR